MNQESKEDITKQYRKSNNRLADDSILEVIVTIFLIVTISLLFAKFEFF